MKIVNFRIYYTPIDKPIDVKNIPYRLVKAASIPQAIKKFEARYTDDRVLYVTKNWGGLT